MLEKAALLKAEWVGSQRHPSMPPFLSSCACPSIQACLQIRFQAWLLDAGAIVFIRLASFGTET